MNLINCLLEVKISHISLQDLDPEEWDRWGMVEGYERRDWNELYVKGGWEGVCNTWPAVAVLKFSLSFKVFD